MTDVEDSQLPQSLPNGSDGKHYSITQSIALEHQLENEVESDKSPMSDSFPTPASLDPEVLTSVVIQLRQTLAKDREQFASALHDANSKNASLESEAADLEELWKKEEERANVAEQKLAEAERKILEGEQSLSMLRSTLEESRRGIMRLQAESKRGSVHGTPASAPGAIGTTPRAAKRMSLNPSSPLPPLSNSRSISHRRISSLSDPGLMIGVPDFSSSLSLSPSPTPSPVPNASFLVNPNVNSPPMNNLSSDHLHPSNAELTSLRAELASTRRALTEAREARQASEDCLRALREFMAANGAKPGDGEPPSDLQGLRLPPLPTDIVVDEDDVPKVEPKKSGWASLRLWKDTSSIASTSTSSSLGSATSQQPPAAERARSSTILSAASVLSTSSSSIVRPSSDVSPTADPIVPQVVTSIAPINSFRTKFGFFSKVAPSSVMSGSAETASIASSRPTSVSENSEGGPHTDDDLVQVILPDGPLEENVLGKERMNLRGDMTPTYGATAF